MPARAPFPSSAQVRTVAARSIANQPLPPVPDGLEGALSLVLFYQYVEPQWSKKEHKEALKVRLELNRAPALLLPLSSRALKSCVRLSCSALVLSQHVINLGRKCGVTGRGRCAAEGLNCTLTGPPAAVRAFCNGLREWKPELFNETDFKITDGLEKEHVFKARPPPLARPRSHPCPRLRPRPLASPSASTLAPAHPPLVPPGADDPEEGRPGQLRAAIRDHAGDGHEHGAACRGGRIPQADAQPRCSHHRRAQRIRERDRPLPASSGRCGAHRPQDAQ